MKVKMACSTNNLLIKKLNTVFLIFKFTSDYSLFEKDFITEGVLKAIGQTSVIAYKNNPYFFAEIDFNSEKVDQLTDNDASLLNSNIHVYNEYIQNFIQYLWFVKDNCCGVNSFHTYIPDAKKTIVRTYLTTYSTCHGKINEPVEFNQKELQRVVEIYLHCIDILPKSNLRKLKKGELQPDIIAPRKINPVDFKNTNRIERALHFLTMARSTNLLPSKIAFYMCIYECLFSGTDKTEIIHQIAERTAFYMGAQRYQRIDIYDLIKEGYSIRSSYYHGKKIKTHREDLLKLSEKVDMLTRELFLKVFFVDYEVFAQESDEKLQKAFKELIFRDRELNGVLIESAPEYLVFSDR